MSAGISETAVRVGIDIGGTKTHAVALASDGSIITEVTEATARGANGILLSIERAVRELAQTSAMDVRGLTSVGIGIPGQVDAETGTVRQALNLDVDEWHIADDVDDLLGIRPSVDNDVNAAALGARSLLGVTGSMAFLNLGTGVAAGIHLDGGLLRGSRGAAGEIGHISIDPRGPLCDCGQRGCIEAFSGGSYLARRADESSVHPLLGILDAADAGDAEALATVRGFARGVAGALRTLFLTFDVDRVIVGGGVIAIGPRIETIILDEVTTSVRASAFLDSLELTSRISFLAGSLRAPAIGAALLTKDS